MAPPRKVITRDMIQAAKDKGWHLTLAASHYGMHRSSIAAACERFGIALPMHQFSPQRVSKKSKVWVDIIDGETKPKVKLSASPAAIRRAIEDMEREKRLRALGGFDTKSARGAHKQETVTGCFVLVEDQTALRLISTIAPLAILHHPQQRQHKATELAEWYHAVILVNRDHQAIARDAPGCDWRLIFHLDLSGPAPASQARPLCGRS